MSICLLSSTVSLFVAAVIVQGGGLRRDRPLTAMVPMLSRLVTQSTTLSSPITQTEVRVGIGENGIPAAIRVIGKTEASRAGCRSQSVLESALPTGYGRLKYLLILFKRISRLQFH